MVVVLLEYGHQSRCWSKYGNDAFLLRIFLCVSCTIIMSKTDNVMIYICAQKQKIQM